MLQRVYEIYHSTVKKSEGSNCLLLKQALILHILAYIFNKECKSNLVVYFMFDDIK